MRILYMTQWFDPEPAFKGIAFAKALRSRGCDVRVATGFPNYPGGRLYPGYPLRPFRRDRMDGIVVDRLPLYPSHSRSSIGRAFNYVSFALSLFAYAVFTAGRADAIYAYSPPITVAVAATLAGWLRRRPVVVDVQDLWPDSLQATRMVENKTVIRLVSALCRFVYRRAARIVVISPGMKRTLIERGVTADKIDVVFNWADEQYTNPRRSLDLARFALAGRFNVVFAGNLGLAQGLDVVLDAARRTAEIEPRLQFLLVGDGVDAPRLQKRIEDEGLVNVRIERPVARADVADLLDSADVLLVSLADDPLFEITIPSKTQFYLAMGKPILVSGRGDVANIVTEAKAGLCAPPGDAEGLATAAVALSRADEAARAAMGQRGRAYFLNNMSMAAGIEQTIRILEGVAQGEGRVPVAG